MGFQSKDEAQISISVSDQNKNGRADIGVQFYGKLPFMGEPKKLIDLGPFDVPVDGLLAAAKKAGERIDARVADKVDECLRFALAQAQANILITMGDRNANGKADVMVECSKPGDANVWALGPLDIPVEEATSAVQLAVAFIPPPAGPIVNLVVTTAAQFAKAFLS